MKAFTIKDYSSGNLLADDLPPPPPPKPKEVQLRLLGASINPIDRLIAGGYGAPLLNRRRKFPVILGRDGVALVMAVGAGIKDLQPGQRVIAVASPMTGGTYAELFNLPRYCVVPIDNRLSNKMAAGIGYAGLTAIQMLGAAGLSAENASGKLVCINGASGGVGSIALLLASRWGAQVTAVASKKNHPWLQSLAPCKVVDYRDPVAMQSIVADIILNCATPVSENPSDADPLLSLLNSRSADYRAYSTTMNPVLSDISHFGIIGGALKSGITYLQQRLKLQLRGIRYRWVLFKENPTQLAYLVDFFSQSDIPADIFTAFDLQLLPQEFNNPDLGNSRAKTVFMFNSE